MAITSRSFVLIPAVTLCFLLVLALAAVEQGKPQATTTLLVTHGIARCRNNFSRIISNAPMYLVINNATVPGGAGRTTIDGRLLITVTLNSTEQLAALMSNGSSGKAYLIAPRDACGVPNLPPWKQMAAAVQPIATMMISDDAGSSSSVQSLAAAAAAASGTVGVVNGSLHADAATNNGGAVRLNRRLLHNVNGDAAVSGANGGPLHVIVAKPLCYVCSAITIFQ